jgi:DNA-binding NarL/FixJ family response regulator
VRVVIADDSLIVRQGLARMLTSADIEVVDTVGDADALHRTVALNRPDAAVIDVRMPPTFSDEGLTAANRLATERPDTAVLLLSQYDEPAYVTRLLETSPNRRGYLLKERVTHADVLIDALHRVHEGETVVDTTIVDTAISTPNANRRVDKLTERERDVLRCLAAGRTDRGICQELGLSPKTVATHIAHIFAKLELPDSAHDNRRVHAVLTYLDHGRSVRDQGSRTLI